MKAEIITDKFFYKKYYKKYAIYIKWERKGIVMKHLEIKKWNIWIDEFTDWTNSRWDQRLRTLKTAITNYAI